MKKLGFFLVGFMIFVFSLHLAVNHAVAKLSEDIPEEKAQVVQAKPHLFLSKKRRNTKCLRLRGQKRKSEKKMLQS